MTKKRAQKILNKYVKSKVFTSLPIVDKVMIIGIEQWSFKGLIKIAYNLQDCPK